jgi:hypothetical protein
MSTTAMSPEDLPEYTEEGTDVSGYEWVQYGLRVLVRKDREKPERATLVEHLKSDLKQAEHVEGTRMGPRKDAAVCGRDMHVIDVDEAARWEHGDGDDCQDCQGEAERQQERQLEGL